MVAQEVRGLASLSDMTVEVLSEGFVEVRLDGSRRAYHDVDSLMVEFKNRLVCALRGGQDSDHIQIEIRCNKSGK